MIKDNYLYILCGTNQSAYNSDVYEINLLTMTCTRIGQTFDEIDHMMERGR
jgi:hypothetical protein